MSKVLESSHEVKKLNPIPKITTLTTASMETKLDQCLLTRVPMNKVAIKICVPQRPLHREKLLVIIAINFSLGLYNSCSDYSCGITTKSHTHG